MKRSESTKNDFYCENCGKPVSSKARRCPHCGKEFLAVKCPQCSFAGKAELFETGCPVCGYNAADAEASLSAGEGSAEPKTSKSRPAAVPSKPEDTEKVVRIRRGNRWFYWVISIVLVGAIVALILLYTRL